MKTPYSHSMDTTKPARRLAATGSETQFARVRPAGVWEHSSAAIRDSSAPRAGIGVRRGFAGDEPQALGFPPPPQVNPASASREPLSR